MIVIGSNPRNRTRLTGRLHFKFACGVLLRLPARNGVRGRSGPVEARFARHPAWVKERRPGVRTAPDNWVDPGPYRWTARETSVHTRSLKLNVRELGAGALLRRT